MERKKKIIIALVCVIILLLAGILAVLLFMGKIGTSEYEKQISLGNKYLEEENYEKAIEAFETAVNIEPKKTEAYLGLADAYLFSDEMGWKSAAGILLSGFQAASDEVMINKMLEIGKSREAQAEKQEILDMVRTVYPNIPEKIIELYWEEQEEEETENTKPDDKEDGLQEENAGNISGNINNGGYVVENNEYVVYSFQDALWSMKQDGSGRKKIYDGRCSSLNLWGDKVYFLAEKEEEDYMSGTYYVRTPYSVKLDGSGLSVIGQPAAEKKYSVSYRTDYETAEECTVTAGYRGFIVYDDYIYYIGDNERSGSYTCYARYEDGEELVQEVTYRNNTSIYRMKLDGTEVTELVQDLGNAYPVMCISDGKLYYALNYYNAYFGNYGFTKFFCSELDGTKQTEFPAVKSWEETVFDSDYGNYTEMLIGIQVSDGKLYVSCGDSEGEFPDSRFHLYDENIQGLGEKILEERCWNKTVVSDGQIYASTGGREWTDGRIPLTNRALAVCGEDGQIIKLLKVFDEETYGSEEYFNNLYYDINVSGDWVYYRIQDKWGEGIKEELGRISKDGTRQEIFQGD